MKIIIEDTIKQYEKLFCMGEGREDFYRYSMMKPFEKMWNTINIPLKANQPAGLSSFAGYAVGYQAVQSFMKVNNVGIGDATLLETREILNNCELFSR
ncbi:MAG TPA: hypothetical protein GXX18_12595 [Bacillales bacterium]|nr:hypothetical protein [Bacillales bacterium]